MAVFVTGGAGFIGSHTVVELIESGYEVVVADNFSNSCAQSLERIEKITGAKPVFYEIDVCSRQALEAVFEENDIEAVIHFAGLKSVPESVSMPVEYYRTNIDSTLALLEVMEKHGCRKIVFSSSATVYSPDNSVPFVETMNLAATNPYGWSKVMNERIISDKCTSDGEWSAALLRYFNPIGAHPSGLIGEDPNGIPLNLFPLLMRVYNGKMPYIKVCGTDYDTPDGTGQRDYIHVCDLARGHISALRYIEKNKGMQAINLGTGKPTSVLELIAAFGKAAGRELDSRITERRPGDIACSYADVTKAHELLGWEAQYGIDEMCAHGIKFASLNPDGYRA